MIATKNKIKATVTSRIIKPGGLSFNEKPTYINAIATNTDAANNLVEKNFESIRERIIITTAATMPEITSIILFVFNLSTCG